MRLATAALLALLLATVAWTIEVTLFGMQPIPTAFGALLGSAFGVWLWWRPSRDDDRST